MLDKIDALEERIDRLLRGLKNIHDERDRLIQENEELRRAAAAAEEEAEKTREENDQNGVEPGKDLESYAEREKVIRDRLQGILDRLDELEAEIRSSAK